MTITTRREAREALFELVYEMSFCEKEERLAFLMHETEVREISEPYVIRGIRGVVEHTDEIDEVISKHSIGWKLERLSRVSHAILRLCCYEMMFTELGVRIAINEAVEIAKKFDHDQAPNFINGVLNAIADDLGLKNKPEAEKEKKTVSDLPDTSAPEGQVKNSGSSDKPEN